MILTSSANYYNRWKWVVIMGLMRRQLLVWILLLLAACRPMAEEPVPCTLLIHPDGSLYIGDLISFEVLPPASLAVEGQQVQVSLGEQVLGNAAFAPFGIASRMQATLYWVWDTHGLSAGRHTLTFSLLPDGSTWQETVSLEPPSHVPPPEPEARWASTVSACCTIYYITGTPAERDIDLLIEWTDSQARDVSNRMQAVFDKKIAITFLPRVLGQGGFSSDSIYVSYLDQNYMGSATAQVIHHEMVHVLDAQLGGGFHPAILVEGLAVYLSGGHLKPENLGPRAAALLEVGWYIPLRTLMDGFYPEQHEIGYLEAGTLVQYLVETYSWKAFDAFYRDIPSPEDQKPTTAIGLALQAHFGITPDDLDTRFLAYLNAQPVSESDRVDLALTVHFYDTARRYQQLLDPSAYFMTAWLPDGSAMRTRGIVADFLRHPESLNHQFLERLLMQVDHDLRSGAYVSGERTLNIINAVLDTVHPR